MTIIYDGENAPRTMTIADFISMITDQDSQGNMSVKVKVVSDETPPTDIQLSNTTVTSGSIAGTRIGIITVVDSSSESHTLSITNDPDEKFAIEAGATNYLVLRGSVDYDTKEFHEVTIKAVNEFDLSYSKDFIIEVLEDYTNTESLLFNGIDEFATGGNVHNYDIADAFSVCMWINPNNIAATRLPFSKAGASPTVRGWYPQIIATTGAVNWAMRTGTTNRSHTFDVFVTAAEWQLLCITYAGGSDISGTSCYRNAVKNTTNPSGSLSGTMLEGQAFILGQRNGSVGFYSGLQDEITIWDKELSAAEITELYNAGVTYDYTQHSAAANLQSWYRIDGDTIPTLTDSVGAAPLSTVNMDATNISTDVPS